MKWSFYETGKWMLKGFVPRPYQNKTFGMLRQLFGFVFKGSQFQCTICNVELRKFLIAANKNIICPKCGSTERSRTVWFLYDTMFATNRPHTLHFSPNPALQNKFKGDLRLAKYQSTDFCNEFAADSMYDITAIDLPENSFDLIICMHVLEHIDNDHKAMEELYRVLSPNGTIIVQTPFKSGEIYENVEITSPSERKKHFGQEDHVRIYSVDGLKDRLEQVGFQVREATIDLKTMERNQFTTNPILLATKPKNSQI